MFVPDSFIVPDSFETESFYFSKLIPEFAEPDYNAVMSSKERLRTVFAELTEWPRDNMSIDENIADLRRHEHEFNNRIAFVYSVFNKSRENYIGCLYIEPGGKKVYDSAVFMWVSNMFTESDEILFSEAKRRIADYWPFKNPAYPGREITWSEWETIR